VIALLISASMAALVALLGTRWLIPWLQDRRVGQPIRVEGPVGHHTKAGTPTMGGVMIVAAAVVAYAVAHVRAGVIFTRGGMAVMLAIVGAGVVGLLDDWIKVTRTRNLGLNKRAKLIGLVVVALVFAFVALRYANVDTRLAFTRVGPIELDLGPVGWTLWALLVILASGNAVNLTDGLDGLAGGAAAFGFTTLIVIAFWAFRHPATYGIPQALDLAVIAAAMAGGCIGFLWWNAPPARIFMGDTGSLALGTGLATLALLTKTDLLLILIGGLFVLEAVSVIVQVGSFRLLGGRRILRMAPIHHHFELGGWPETTVLIRLWIVNAFFNAIALGLYYADFVSTGALD
jgi:phospho-N-acetylmuramoyl-pentapeptide-transferase